MKIQVTADNINDYCMEDMVPDAFCSALVQDCLERGKHIKQGGPIYDFISGAQIGVPDVGNSLAAIKECIYDNKVIDINSLLKALKNDFKGIEGIKIRNKLLAASKYGNDIDEVDQLTKRAFDVYCHNIAKYKNMRIGTGPIGCGWYASTVTLTANIPAGEVIGALPSGRLSGRPLADGISPVHSVSKLSNILVTGGQLLNMRFIPQMLKDKKGLEGILNLMKVFFEQKGWHIQFNVISTDILRKAQKQPEEYRDLVIRVAGYSALFVSLDPKVQEDIISRTQYEIS
jgi:formate C-acetyltransferase